MPWTYLASEDQDGDPIWFVSREGAKEAIYTVYGSKPGVEIEPIISGLNLHESMNDAFVRLPDPAEQEYDIIFTPARKPRPIRRR